MNSTSAPRTSASTPALPAQRPAPTTTTTARTDLAPERHSNRLKCQDSHNVCNQRSSAPRMGSRTGKRQEWRNKSKKRKMTHWYAAWRVSTCAIKSSSEQVHSHMNGLEACVCPGYQLLYGDDVRGPTQATDAEGNTIKNCRQDSCKVSSALKGTQKKPFGTTVNCSDFAEKASDGRVSMCKMICQYHLNVDSQSNAAKPFMCYGTTVECTWQCTAQIRFLKKRTARRQEAAAREPRGMLEQQQLE